MVERSPTRCLTSSGCSGGVTSHERYVNRREHEMLAAIQEGLGRLGSTRAALIPIRSRTPGRRFPRTSAATSSRSARTTSGRGLEYLPPVARRLHHGRDLGAPFDFLTWFEYAPANAPAFEQLVERLRETEEWTYVEREVDIRLVRGG